MRKLALACAVALAIVHTRVVRADPILAATVLQFGVSVTSALQSELPRFVYMPVIGPWVDLGRTGVVQGTLVFDGLCQDVVGLAFVVRMFSLHERPPPWRVLPWFPQSGGGGLSLRGTF